jgi:hypothetical protein
VFTAWRTIFPPKRSQRESASTRQTFAPQASAAHRFDRRAAVPELLDLVSATAPEGIGRAWTYALATGAAGVVVMVVAVSAACSVFARLQVAHIHFFLCFVHMTFLHLLFGCVSRAE